jgi:pimeloyl-ACP methyl ester carboxylesterase
VTTVGEHHLVLSDGAVLHVHDTGAGTGTRGGDRPVVVWHHGTPNTGSPPAPLFAAAERLGLRWVSWDRPGYGSSTPRPGRDVASAASYALEVADALSLDRFAVMGHSGGGPHALACAALLPERVTAAVLLATLAPYDAVGLDHAHAMTPSGVAVLRAASAGRAARERWDDEHGDDYDPEFTATDLAALGGEWGWFGQVVGEALESGPGPAIDDDVAYASPWGFDPASVRAPCLLVTGDADRVAPLGHARWLAARIPGAELRVRPRAGHLAVMQGAAEALDWLARAAGR